MNHRGPREGDSEEAWRATLAALEREQDDLWAKIAKHSPQVRALTTSVALSDVQAHLPAGAALVEYVRYRAVLGRNAAEHEPRYAAYVVFPERFDWVDLGPAAPIDDQIEHFRRTIMLKADVTSSGHRLYDSIMRPVVDRIGLTHLIFVAPDGNLDLVPFDALVDEYDNYLAERFNLHLLTSGRDLLRPWSLEPVSDGAVVIVANPTGANLPGTEHEAELLASVFSETRPLLGDQATETNILTIERPHVFHLATHGFFGEPHHERDNPMFRSGLILANPEQVEVDREHDDGKLTAYEVSSWDLRGTELVTLSACDTGRGRYQQGEGILGLRRAFAIAGAQSQVMSLWKVSDTITAKLMAAYYRRLLAGEGRSEAMRNTQLELLRDPATRHPRDWAAFVVVGEWGPLSGSTLPKHDATDCDPPEGCGCHRSPTKCPSDPTGIMLVPFLALVRRGRHSTRRSNRPRPTRPPVEPRRRRVLADGPPKRPSSSVSSSCAPGQRPPG